MRYTTLGNTGLRVSRVGLGTGGKSALGQIRGFSESESHAVIHRALDLGITFFDTSPAYRDSEAILGRALHAAGVTDQVTICTKVITYRTDGSVGPDGEVPVLGPADIIESVERSLQRLHRDTLDILLLHAVLPELYDAVVERLYATLAKLREQGKVRHLGVSEQARADSTQAVASRAVQSDLFDVIMLRYNLFHQGAERRIFPITAENGIGVLGMCPVDPPITRPHKLQQWLSELKDAGKLDGEALSRRDPVMGWIEEGAAALSSAGMKFVAHQPGIDAVITGTANIDHLEHNVQAALGDPLPPDAEAAIRRIYGRLDEGRLTVS